MLKITQIAAASACCLALCSTAFAAQKSVAFSYYADGSELSSVLSSFAKTQGYGAESDPCVQGKVRGRFTRVAPRDFLAAMEEAYGIGHYVLGRTMHFYCRKDLVQDFIQVPSGSSAELVESLKRSNFIAKELPVTISADGGLLSVKGPASYLQQIRTAAAAYQNVMSEKIVMKVFPVKYAWADDITLQNMDQTVVVPGIASILRGMVLGQAVSGSTVSRSESTAPSVPSLGAEGLSKQRIYEDRKAAAAASAATETPIAAGSISIIADPRVNAVLVSDAAYRMPYYEKIIKDLDKPVELVEIHAAIVDIDTNVSRELGVNLSGRDASGRVQSGGSLGAGAAGGVDSAGNPIVGGASSTAGALLSTIYTHGSDYFMARISALEEENAARMLGRPSVLTVDNVQAVLENTTSYYIPLRGTEAVDLYRVDSGTVLRVTPHIIHSAGKASIKLAVSVQDDQSDAGEGYQNVGGENSSTITVSPIKQTKINTQAVVDVGQSLLIGGYYYEQKSEGTSGVPLLKDIPLIGGLFRTSSKSGRQMERLILITPRIVTPDVDNVPSRVKTSTFRQKATQDNYDMQPPAASGKKADRAPAVEKVTL